MSSSIKYPYSADTIKLSDASMKVFNSAQINLKGVDKDLKYMEIPVNALTEMDTTNKWNFQQKIGANPTSLKNQSLEIGDVLISGRTVSSHKIAIIGNKHLHNTLPTVAINGMVIIRTKDIDLASFIKFYLEQFSVQHELALLGSNLKGMRRITKDTILQLLFPNILNKDFKKFNHYQSKYNSLLLSISETHKQFEKLKKQRLSEALYTELNNDSFYVPERLEELSHMINDLKAEIEHYLHPETI